MSTFAWSRGFIPGVHLGVDLAAPVGTPIHAVQGGVVTYAADTRQDPAAPSWSFWQGRRGAAGIAAAVDVGGGRTELYVHLSRLGVTRGSRIRAGDVVGLVGATGYAFGSHLHFGVIESGTFRDPLTIWTRAQLIAAVSSGSSVIPASSPGGGLNLSKPQFDAWYACIGAQPWDTIDDALAARMGSCAAAGGIDIASVGLDPRAYVGRTVRDFALAMSQATGHYIGPETVVGAVLGGIAGALAPLLWLAAILVIIILGLYVTLSAGGDNQ